jgi:putative endonuclease
MGTRQSTGRWGEDLAVDFLQRKGYSILERNVHTPYGEIDIIAEDKDLPLLIFVEVKTRRSKQFGLPEDAVNLRKQNHFRSAAEYYLQQHPDFTGAARLDVIAIQHYLPDQLPLITHFENAFS